LKNALVSLVEAHLKPILDYSSKIGYCKVDLCNVHVGLYQVSVKIKAILEQEIVKLVRLSIAESVGNVGFSSS